MASVPFSLTGALNYPPDDDDSPADQSFSSTGSFDSEAKFRLVLSGTGTQTVSLGTIATNGAKIVRIEVNTDAAAPVLVRINGSSTGGMQLAAGGVLIYSNPTPDGDGILSLDIDYTDDAVVKVTALG